MVGDALWKSVALESVLYGMQAVRISNIDLEALDSVQRSFAADLLGVPRSTSGVGVLRELGWRKISTIIKERKLIFWTRLSALPDNNLAKKALEDSFSLWAEPASRQKWKSSYMSEILEICREFSIGDVLSKGGSPARYIKQRVSEREKLDIAKALEELTKHSLKYLPEYADKAGMQSYMDGSEESFVIASFRLGNAGLGNRSTPKIEVCPVCKEGPNNELHLVFECRPLEFLRYTMGDVFHETDQHHQFEADDPRKLQNFLGGDNAGRKTLKKRASLLMRLKEEHETYKRNTW